MLRGLGLIAYCHRIRREKLGVREGSIVVPQNIKEHAADKDIKDFIGKECRVIILSKNEIRIATEINGNRRVCWCPRSCIEIKKY